jgi:hypothetical protein
MTLTQEEMDALSDEEYFALELEDGKRPPAWGLRGQDSFDYNCYPIEGKFRSVDAAMDGARAQLKKLEATQPSETSGGQGGLQDWIYIVHPDGQQTRVLR